MVPPVWVGFDHLVDPQRASLFLHARLIAQVPVVVSWLLLFTSFGRRHAAPLLLFSLTVLNVLVAFMISRAGHAAGAYSMGMALVIFTGAFALIWSWRWNTAMISLALPPWPSASPRRRSG